VQDGYPDSSCSVPPSPPLSLLQIAVMGDDLRKHYTGWPEIWRFVLLYGTVISVWHDMTVLWNYVDTKRDFVEQITIILLIICLAGIGTRAEEAFRLTTRSLSFFSFFAILVGVIRLCLDTWLNDYDGKVLRNPRLVNACLTAIFALPYLIVALLPDEENARAPPYLYLAAIILQSIRQLAFHHVYDWTRRRWFPSVVMPTIHVDAMAERYALITLIVFGETFVSTLVEGQKVFSVKADTALFGATTCAIAITFCLHSMYADVDNRLVAGDKQYVYHSKPDSPPDKAAPVAGY
jgi:low temperature requirement protein LtrA